MKSHDDNRALTALQVYYPIYRGSSPRSGMGLPLGEHAVHASLTLLTLGLWLPIWHYRHQLVTKKI